MNIVRTNVNKNLRELCMHRLMLFDIYRCVWTLHIERYILTYINASKGSVRIFHIFGCRVRIFFNQDLIILSDIFNFLKYYQFNFRKSSLKMYFKRLNTILILLYAYSVFLVLTKNIAVMQKRVVC